jgi:succinylarginine dihydrolase
VWSPALHDKLTVWVQRHYRDELRPDDLRDPKLIDESRAALDELAGILNMQGLYG